MDQFSMRLSFPTPTIPDYSNIGMYVVVVVVDLSGRESNVGGSISSSWGGLYIFNCIYRMYTNLPTFP